MRKADTVMALALVLGAGILLKEALSLPVAWTGKGPGSGFFPFWLAVGVTASAAIIFLKSLKRLRAPSNPGHAETFIPPRAWKPLLVVFLPMVAIVAFIDYLGIYIGGTIYLAGYMWLVGRHRLSSIILVSVLVPLVLFFIFEKWFLLPMPKGAFLEYVLYGR